MYRERAARNTGQCSPELFTKRKILARFLSTAKGVSEGLSGERAKLSNLAKSAVRPFPFLPATDLVECLPLQRDYPVQQEALKQK